MNGKHTLPADIERTSMAIITQELAAAGIELPPQHAAVVKRVIHTTADFDYAQSLCFTPDAVARGVAALRQGVSIVTDTNMAKAGVSKPSLAKLGGTVACFMADGDVAAAQENGTTRRTRPWKRPRGNIPARCWPWKRAYGAAAPGGADRGRAAAGAGRGGARGLCECGGEQGAHLRRVQGGGRSGHSLHGPQGRQQCGRGHLQRAALHGRGRTGPRPAGLAGLTAGPECGMICPPGRRCMRCLSGRGRGYFEWRG